MEKNILESLAELENCLNKVDSARTMVENTIASYNNVSAHVNNYAEALSGVSGIISNLIIEIKQNKDNLSASIGGELQEILKNFNSTVGNFQTSASDLLDGFKTEATSLQNGLSTKLGASTTRLDESSRQIGNKFNESADNVVSTFTTRANNSLTKLDSAVSKFNADVEAFNKSLKSLFDKQHEEFVEIRAENKMLRYLLVVTIVLNITILACMFILK